VLHPESHRPPVSETTRSIASCNSARLSCQVRAPTSARARALTRTQHTALRSRAPLQTSFSRFRTLSRGTKKKKKNQNTEDRRQEKEKKKKQIIGAFVAWAQSMRTLTGFDSRSARNLWRAHRGRCWWERSPDSQTGSIARHRCRTSPLVPSARCAPGPVGSGSPRPAETTCRHAPPRMRLSFDTHSRSAGRFPLVPAPKSWRSTQRGRGLDSTRRWRRMYARWTP